MNKILFVVLSLWSMNTFAHNPRWIESRERYNYEFNQRIQYEEIQEERYELERKRKQLMYEQRQLEREERLYRNCIYRGYCRLN